MTADECSVNIARMNSAKKPLANDLAALPGDLRERLNAAGFNRDRFLQLAAELGENPTARAERNRVNGEVSAPLAHEIRELPPPGSADEERLRALGKNAIEKGELAFCVMAGGMATRMGGVVKALVEALQKKTFLELRLNENKSAGERAKRAVPLWLMTSEATDEKIREALKAANAPAHVRAFMQDLGVRLTAEGDLFRDQNGNPSVHATGHGDLPDALRRSGLLHDFVKSGGKYVWITNLDNLGASIDDVVLGSFIDSKSDVMVEVCDKEASDRGGIPVRANGKLQVLEEFRLPTTFDPSVVRVFNTNTFLVNARLLLDAPFTWTFFQVEKKVDGVPVVQFERLLQEITAHLNATYLRVPRNGEKSRFLPVKDHDELARRSAEIEVVARTRGMV